MLVLVLIYYVSKYLNTLLNKKLTTSKVTSSDVVSLIQPNYIKSYSQYHEDDIFYIPSGQSVINIVNVGTADAKVDLGNGWRILESKSDDDEDDNNIISLSSKDFNGRLFNQISVDSTGTKVLVEYFS